MQVLLACIKVSSLGERLAPHMTGRERSESHPQSRQDALRYSSVMAAVTSA